MKEIEIPNDSEQKGFELTIPNGMEAIIKDGKVIVREKESEDEMIRKHIIDIIKDNAKSKCIPCDAEIAYLERQKEQPTDAKLERVVKAARRVLNNWLDGTDCPDVSGDFEELEYAIREYDGEEKQKDKVVKFDHDREQKPAEWSEEDKQCLDVAIEILENLGYDGEADNLKHLCPHPHWKPSKDEITAIEVAMKFLLAHTSDEKLRVNATSVIEHLKLL